LVKWAGSRLVWRGDRQASVVYWHVPESQGDCVENKHVLYLVVTLTLFGCIAFSFVYNKTFLTLRMTYI
jgi:hypothetical protein